MDQSSEMAAFVTVVREAGFSSAARTLHLTPSAVSKQISRLEDRLGVRLLNRTTRRFSMTDEGEAYYQRAVSILAEIAETEAMISNRGGAPRGILRVSCSTTFGRQQVVPLLPEFLGRFPEISMQLSLSDTMVDLVQEGVDVAIRIAELSDSTLVARRLGMDRRIVCAAPSYVEKHGLPKVPEDLRDHNCLILNTAQAINDWEFSSNGESRRIHIEGTFEANSGIAVHAATLAGLGIAQLASYVAVPDLKAGRLISCLDEFVVSQRPIYAIYPHRRHLSPKVREFVNFLIDKFTPTPPWGHWPVEHEE
ncbi:MAG: LysR family transcriptional regulator [Alphaproteobacteria bacterium]